MAVNYDLPGHLSKIAEAMGLSLILSIRPERQAVTAHFCARVETRLVPGFVTSASSEDDSRTSHLEELEQSEAVPLFLYEHSAEAKMTNLDP